MDRLDVVDERDVRRPLGDLTRYQGCLDRAARALCRDRHEAEDLVQETYAAVLRRPRDVEPGAELAYLVTAMRHRYIDDVRRRRRRPQEVALDTVADMPNERSPHAPEAALDHAELLRALRELPAPYRAAVTAIDVMGLSYREAALALAVPAGTVMSRVYRGRNAMARRHGAED